MEQHLGFVNQGKSVWFTSCFTLSMV